MPARKWPSVEPSESAPLTRMLLSCWAEEIACWTKSLSCASVMWNGPSSSHSRKSSHATSDCAASSSDPRAMNVIPTASRPPTTIRAESMATVTASHFGQRCRCRSCENGTSSAPMSTATSTGMTMSRSWMMRKMMTAITPPTSRSRHDQAAAMRMPNGTESDASRCGGGGGVSRSPPRRLPIDLPRACPVDSVIAPV